MANHEPIDEGLRPFATGRDLEIIDAVNRHGSHRKAAKALGVARGTIGNTLANLRKRAERRGYSPEHDQTHACPDTQYIKGVSTMYDGDGNVRTQWVKTNARFEAMQDALRVVAEELAEEVRGKARPRKRLPKFDSERLATHYKVGDHHEGLYAWGQETGGDDWDSGVSRKVFRGAFDYLVESSPATEVGVLVDVGDGTHINDRKNATPASGNRLDVDSRFGRVVRASCNNLKYAVDRMLDKHRTVKVIKARGNHDPDLAICLSLILEAYYDKEPRVSVTVPDGYWQAWEWGQTVVFVNHGESPRARQHQHLSREFGTLWGARHKYVDNGHIHHKQVEEVGGVKFESWNVMPPADGWHADSGYGASRSMTSVVYDLEYGETARNVCDIRLAERMGV